MSIHTDDLRDIAANHGWPVCDLAADEIEDLEKAYALLFAENAKLQKALAAPPESVAAVPVLTLEMVNAGLMALLKCTYSEIEDYSAKLMDEYTDDVRRVYSAMLSKAPPAPAHEPPDGLLQVVADAWTNYERMGEVCAFEGQPMIYASTLEEINAAANIEVSTQQSSKDESQYRDNNWWLGWNAAIRSTQTAPAREPLDGWQPIETAPKNKKLIAGYQNKLDNWRTVMASYYPADTLPNHDEYTDDEFAPEGWYEECESQEVIMPTDETPTHWQPLPTTPSNTKE